MALPGLKLHGYLFNLGAAVNLYLFIFYEYFYVLDVGDNVWKPSLCVFIVSVCHLWNFFAPSESPAMFGQKAFLAPPTASLSLSENTNQ